MVHQGSEFYNTYFIKWLRDNDISMYSTDNEGKPVVAERFIRTLRNKIYKHIAVISKNVYFDVFNDIVLLILLISTIIHTTEQLK